jgi:SNF2 family DNA or RNA helicase
MIGYHMNNAMQHAMNEDSPRLTADDLKLVKAKLRIPLKKHQETSVRAMLALEQAGKIEVELESRVSRNEIILKADRSDNPYYTWYLRDHFANEQYSMNRFEVQTNYGILADKVGAGKTFEVLGLLAHTLVPPCHPKILSSSFYSSIRWHDTERPIKTNLIIVPHNLVMQWKQTLGYTRFNSFVVSKRAHIDELKSIENIHEGSDGPDTSLDVLPEECIGFYEVVVVSSTMIEQFQNKFGLAKWARLIIDEITSIKLPVVFEIRANFIWYITATPYGIRYIRRAYIRDMIAGIQRSIFNRIIIKCDDDYVSSSMSLPALNQVVIHCDTPMGLRLIREFMPDDVVNMLNAGNIRDAVLRLNCNVDTDENIIKVLTNKLEKEIHNKKLELDYQTRLIPTDRRAHDEAIAKLKDKITSLEARFTMVKERIQSFENESCPICLDDIDMPAVVPCCNNVFCLGCLTRVAGKCPMCRSPLFLKDLHVIDNKIKQGKKKLLSKRDNLVNILHKKVNGKFLVFSNYENTNDSIAQVLKDEGISFAKLAGNVAMINKTIERFKNGNVKVLLLNACHYGSGLNLQMATDIVIYHEMDLELETQVIGRAQRIGRTEPLNVYYLLHDNEKSNCANPSLDINIYDECNEDLMKVLAYDNSNAEANLIEMVEEHMAPPPTRAKRSKKKVTV